MMEQRERGKERERARMRERERESKIEREREIERASEIERECVYVGERERYLQFFSPLWALPNASFTEYISFLARLE
jgi:hypothetical protein